MSKYDINIVHAGTSFIGDDAKVTLVQQESATIVWAVRNLKQQIETSAPTLPEAETATLRAAARIIDAQAEIPSERRDGSLLKGAFHALEQSAKALPALLSAALTAKELFGL